MNSKTTRQQSKQRNAVQRVRVAAPKGSKVVTAANRQRAVRSLVRCLEANPSQQEWSEAVDSVLLGGWPNIMTSEGSQEFFAIVKEALARARSKPVQDATPVQSNHRQAAVNSLQEMVISTPTFLAAFPGIQPVIPFEQVPTLFRTAIREAKASGNPHPDETAIIEYALALLDQSGNVNIRTREQEEFYAGLLSSLDAEGQIRIAYSPSNVTIH